MTDEKLKIWAVSSAAVLGLSAVLPWVSALGTSVTLMDGGDGPLLLGAGAMAAAAVLFGPRLWNGEIGQRLLAVAAAGLGLYEAIHVWTGVQDARNDAGGFGALVGIGMGVYIAGLAALSLAAWAITTHVRSLKRPSAPEST
jgi:hypothetical protein